jgi:hypothetical protein
MPPNPPSAELPSPRTSGDAAYVVAGLVGVAAVVGLIASTARLVQGDFAEDLDRWSAIGGVALGVLALFATWRLVWRVRRGVEQDLALPLEGRLLAEELRAAVAQPGPLPWGWRDRALELYARLEAAGLHEQAIDLSRSAAEAQAASIRERSQ